MTARPQGAELFVVGGAVDLTPAGLTVLPVTVTATAAIGNRGLGGASLVEVTLAFDGRTVATTVIDLPAGGRVPISLSASIDQASAPVLEERLTEAIGDGAGGGCGAEDQGRGARPAAALPFAEPSPGLRQQSCPAQDKKLCGPR